ncbi:hypothetical protein ACLKA7_006912 [Drosophila subpalustris]
MWASKWNIKKTPQKCLKEELCRYGDKDDSKLKMEVENVGQQEENAAENAPWVSVKNVQGTKIDAFDEGR